MSFLFKDPVFISPKKEVAKTLKHRKKGFGSKVRRFDDKPEPVPGVGEYSFDRSLLVKSPSQSKRGQFESKCPQILPHVDKGNPSPMHYNVIDRSNARTAPFSPAGFGKGKVPWPDPLPIPGPLSYPVRGRFEYGNSPILDQKKSATFCSTTERDSCFDRKSFAPGPAKYDVVGDTFKGHHDLEWSKSAGIRFEDIDRDNGVPPSTHYFDEKRDMVEKKRAESLRTSGSHPAKLIGKQNEEPKEAIHTFGADADRFKNSTYGRLDLAALIPAPGYYDDIFRYSINGGKGRVKTATNPNGRKTSQQSTTARQGQGQGQRQGSPQSRMRNIASAPQLGKQSYLDFD